jgi:hypothetical protein
MYKLLLPALFLVLFVGCRPTETYEERQPSHKSPVIINDEKVVEEKPIIVEERQPPIIVQPVPPHRQRIIIDRRRQTPVPQPAPRRPFDRRGERGR